MKICCFFRKFFPKNYIDRFMLDRAIGSVIASRSGLWRIKHKIRKKSLTETYFSKEAFNIRSVEQARPFTSLFMIFFLVITFDKKLKEIKFKMFKKKYLSRHLNLITGYICFRYSLVTVPSKISKKQLLTVSFRYSLY
jgi:hypothetical protein